jgi:hypothetical protein
MLSRDGFEAFSRGAVCCAWAVNIIGRESDLKEKQYKGRTV